MQIKEVNYDIQMSGKFSTQSFGLEINAKAFDILVNKIYTDKIGAIVRELSANAYDSHIDAGKADVPFEIHLPNAMEQYFYIRDYGTGISEEKIYDVYTKVFKSDKTGSNDFVGCMGLGSKTPFCYTDQFTIISYWNGVQYVYLAHKDKRGIPSISASTDNGTPTTEPNGLKVSFAVKDRYDYDQFKNKVHDFLRYYAVKPRIIGQEVSFKLDSVLFENEKFRIYPRDYHSDNNVLMGNIPYKLPFSMSSTGILFKLPIGSIEIEASRESIEDVEHNRKIIGEFNHEVGLILSKLKDEIIADKKSRVDCNWNLHQGLQSTYAVFGSNNSSKRYDIPTFVKLCNSWNPRSKVRQWSITPDFICNLNDIPSGGKYLFIRHPKDVMIKKRQFEWIEDNFFSLTIIAFTDDVEQQVINHFEILPQHVFDITAIPFNPLTPRVKSGPSTIIGWKKFLGHGTYDNHCWMNDTKFDVTKDVLCCRKGDKILIGETEYSPVDITKFLQTICNKEVIYGLNILDYKKYKSANKFIDFESWIKTKIIDYITTNKDKFTNVITYHNLGWDDKKVYSFLLDAKSWIPKQICKKINCDSFIQIDSGRDSSEQYTRLSNFAKKLDANFEISLNSSVIEGIKTYNEKYRIIELVENEPDHREEFFKLLLGREKDVASN